MMPRLASGPLPIPLLSLLLVTGAAALVAAPDRAPTDSPHPLPSPELHSTEASAGLAPAEAEKLRRWGAVGHRMAALAAVETLPRGGDGAHPGHDGAHGVEGIPAFLLEARDQLIWLNPEPDRWRDRRFPEMDEAWRYDHYIDLENIPDQAILDEATDRWDFFERLLQAGVENPKVRVGFAPFAVLELHQRMTSSFARWRAEEDPQARRFLEARIIEDAGVLGHFVTDLSQPHHTTIHFNGWDEEQVPNPEGYTTDRGIHSRFESRFVQTHVTYEDILPRVDPEVRVFEDPRRAILAYVRASNDEVEELYRIDRDHGFGPEDPHPVALDFAAERIAVGATMLRDLWWTAWVASAPPENSTPGG
jgi:hypothetical protein